MNYRDEFSELTITALLAYFALGTLAKTMAAMARQERIPQPEAQPVRLMLTA